MKTEALYAEQDIISALVQQYGVAGLLPRSSLWSVAFERPSAPQRDARGATGIDRSSRRQDRRTVTAARTRSLSMVAKRMPPSDW